MERTAVLEEFPLFNGKILEMPYEIYLFFSVLFHIMFLRFSLTAFIIKKFIYYKKSCISNIIFIVFIRIKCLYKIFV